MYRELISDMASEVVRSRMDKGKALAFIRQRSIGSLPDGNRARFVEMVETELMSLHVGNIARFRLRPSEYHTWWEDWR